MCGACGHRVYKQGRSSFPVQDACVCRARGLCVARQSVKDGVQNTVHHQVSVWARKENHLMGPCATKSNRIKSKGGIKSRSKHNKLVQESKRRSGGGIIIKEGDR